METVGADARADLGLAPLTVQARRIALLPPDRPVEGTVYVRPSARSSAAEASEPSPDDAG